MTFELQYTDSKSNARAGLGVRALAQQQGRRQQHKSGFFHNPSVVFIIKKRKRAVCRKMD